MRRVNEFEVRPLTQQDRVLLLELLDASAALWNELNYHRRQAFLNDEDVWQSVSKSKYEEKFKGVLGSVIAQQVIRKNDEAWRSFFAQLENDNGYAGLPGYWKEDDQRILQTVIRNDSYTLEWGERSRLEIPVGMDLKEEYGLGYYELLRLEARGDPKWQGEQGRLELVYDRDAETFTARQPVKNAVPRRDDQMAAALPDGGEGATAAVDIGANNLAAVTTSTGHQRLYHGRPAFQSFRQTTERIAALQEQLRRERYSSRRIRRLYRRRTERRNHLMDALVRDLAEWLHELEVGEVIVGDLDDVLSTHWSATVNEKTHQFWSHGRFRRRLREVLEGEYGITVREEDEGGSSSTCPHCGSRRVDRDGDAFACGECGFEGHSDVVASENLLQMHADGPMARPAARGQNRPREGHRLVPCLEWDDHRWRRRGQSTKEDSADRSTREGKFASGGSGSA